MFIAGKVLLDRKKGRLDADGLALFTGAVVVQVVYQVMMVLLNEGELLRKWGLLSSLLVCVILLDESSDGSIQFIGLFVAVHVFVASLQPAGLVGTPFVSTLLIGCFFVVVLVIDRRNNVNKKWIGYVIAILLVGSMVVIMVKSNIEKTDPMMISDWARF